MAGTTAGGLKAAATIKERHGVTFYQEIGARGGVKGVIGGFASNKVGKDGLTGPQRARVGGLISKRKKLS